MVFHIHSRLKNGIATGLLLAGLGGAAGAQAPGPVSTGGNSYAVNADVDTYFAIGLGGLVEPGAGVNSGVSSNSINDETYVTLLLPNLNGGMFSNADFNIFSDPANNGTGPFSFKQPGYNGNLLVGMGAAVDQAENDDNQSYNIGSTNTTNNYTNSVENLAYTQIEHNFLQPTGDGTNHYGYDGYISTSSSAAGAAAQAPLTTFLNSAEKSYATSKAPVYVTFTFNSDMSRLRRHDVLLRQAIRVCA